MNTLKFWTVFAIGVAAGAGVALIYAPQAGQETRRQLRSNFEDVSEYAKDAADIIGNRADKVAQRSRDAVNDVANSANQAAKKVSQMM